MRNVLLLALILGIAGIVVGYFVFARAPITGDYISIGNLIDPPNNLLGRLVSEIGQFAQIRRNILLTGAGGAVLGLVLGFVVSRR